ncbi:MAG: Ig-like domain-containing protein [Planctomycetota bacterium]
MPLNPPRWFVPMLTFAVLLFVGFASAQTKVSSGEPGGTYGFSVASAGDLNGDGHDDFVVGARDEDVDLGMGVESDVGRVYVYSGIDLSVMHIFVGNDGSGRFGWSVDAGGDFNGDGTGDIVIGAPSNNTFAGAAFIYSGVSTGPNAWELLHTVAGSATNDGAGDSVAFVGNLPRDETDGPDIYDDVAIGIPGSSNGLGHVVITGQKVSLDPMNPPSGTLVEIVDTVITRTSPVSLPPLGFGSPKCFGDAVAGIGDYDGDGVVDFAVGAPGAGNTFNRHGRATVYSGVGLLTGVPAVLLDVVGDSADNLGRSLASAGRFNGEDGDPMTDDPTLIVVGSPSAPAGSNNNGAVQIFRYNAMTSSSELVLRVDSADAPRAFGGYVGFAGDANDDGFDDIFVGSTASGNNNVVIISGGPEDPDGPGPLMVGAAIDYLALGTRLLFSADSALTGTGMGFGFAGDLDTDADGTTDVLIADVTVDGSGAVYLFEGAPRNVAVTDPVGGALVSGATVTLTATADNVDEMQFFVDGLPLGAALTAEPYTLLLDSTTLTDGSHLIRVDGTRTSFAGVVTTVASTDVSIEVDNSGPLAQLTAPADGAVVSGTVDLIATATDASGVATVRFVAGAVVDVTVDPALDPLQVPFDTTLAADGAAALMIEATDTLGLVSTDSVSVTIDNTAPVVTIDAPLAMSPRLVVDGDVIVTATVVDLSLATVEFFAGGSATPYATQAPVDGIGDVYTATFDSTSVADGVLLLEVVGTDGAGASTTATVTVDVANARFIRGDCNADGGYDIADAVKLLTFLFPPAPPPTPLSCEDACDCNDDEALDIGDAVCMLNGLFGTVTVPPPSPHPGCGGDPAGDSLDCAAYTCP